MKGAVMLVGDGASDEVRTAVREHNAKPEVREMKKRLKPDWTEH